MRGRDAYDGLSGLLESRHGQLTRSPPAQGIRAKPRLDSMPVILRSFCRYCARTPHTLAPNIAKERTSRLAGLSRAVHGRTPGSSARISEVCSGSITSVRADSDPVR